VPLPIGHVISTDRFEAQTDFSRIVRRAEMVTGSVTTVEQLSVVSFEWLSANLQYDARR
jgi:hypothetical protein